VHTCLQQLDDNISALELRLSPEEVQEIDCGFTVESCSRIGMLTTPWTAMKPFEVGFPNNFLGPDPRSTGKAVGDCNPQIGYIDWVVDRPTYSSTIKEDA
jgi:hypothetical protein